MFVIAYDISDDPRRMRLFKALKRYGTPVQESVFECHLTPSQFAQVRQEIEPLIEPSVDQVRYYELCHNCQCRIKATSASRMTSDPIAIVV